MSSSNQVELWCKGWARRVFLYLFVLTTASLSTCLLPLASTAQTVSLDDLGAFANPSNAWKTAGEVQVHPLHEGSFEVADGSGLLVGAAPQAGESSDIVTKMVHGDLALEFEVLLSHDAAATVWLQGRYGLRLSDSWRKNRLNGFDNGALVAPHAKGVATVGYGPWMNAARAPGVWQRVRIEFEAPYFNAEGEKTRDARIESVEQNGGVIQQNQLLPAPGQEAPFRDEVAEGPLTFRVERGHIAIRNIHYTKYTDQQVGLEDLTYNLYMESFLDDEFIYWGGAEGNRVSLPDLSSHDPTEVGEAELMHTKMVRGRGNDFALVFKGQMHLPDSGDYTFEANPQGVGAFKVDGEELFRWDGLHEKGSYSRTTPLREGTHSFTLTIFNFGQPNVGLYVEGPGIKRHPLHQGGTIPEGELVEPIVLSPANGPRIQRSFMFHRGQKLLTCMNVGYPEGPHYTVNMATGGLVQVWRGPFGSTTSMWHGRGTQQVLRPLGSVLPLSADQQVLLAESLAESSSIQSTAELRLEDYQRTGYTLNDQGEPVLEYVVGSVSVRDHISPDRDAPILKRSLRFSNREGSTQAVWYHVASATTIEQVSDNMYDVDDKTYFVEVGEEVETTIIRDGEQQALFIPLQVGSQPQTLTYSLVW